jgi:hypothetical protein
MTREKQEDPNLEQIPLVQDRLEKRDTSVLRSPMCLFLAGLSIATYCPGVLL